MKAEEMFENYKEMKKELLFLEMQLRNYKGITESDIIDSMTFGGQPSGDRVQSSNISDRTCKVALTFRERLRKENEDYSNFLYSRYKELKSDIDFFEECVRMLGDHRSDIVFEILDGDLTWNEIAQQYNIGRRTVGNIRQTAIRDLDRMFEQRNQLEMAYLLS